MAYLGKISAVLTANTRDFTRQIGTARRELQGFAAQARGIQFNLDRRALDQTLTGLQRFQRTVQEIQRLQRQGVDAGLPDPRRLQDLYRAFEDIGRPLTVVKNQIEGLSTSIQSELYPELQKIQGGFRNLYQAIDSGQTTFDRETRRIESLRGALVRLRDATAVTADLAKLSSSLNASNAGASFAQPRAREALQQSLALRGQAQNIPARNRDGSAFAALAIEAEENANEIERQAARVAAIQLRIARGDRGANALAARGAAQQNLNRLTARQEAINAGFQTELRSAQIREVVSPEAPRQVDVLVERVRSLAADLRAIDSQRFNGLISGAAGVVEQFNRGAVSAGRARQEVERLAAALNNAQIGSGLQDETRNLLFTAREQRQQRIQSNFDRSVAGLGADDPARRRAEIERDVLLSRDRLNSEVIPRTSAIADQARGTGEARDAESARRLLEINKQINNELEKADNLAQNKQYDKARASLERVNVLLREQDRIEKDIQNSVAVTNDARRQSQLFLEASGGLGEQLSQGARDAASDISVARQFRGGIRDGRARVEIASEIARVEASIVSLQKRIAEVAASDLGSDEKIAELNRLDNEIRESTAGLAGFVAQRSAGAYSADQIDAAMGRQKNNAGSIGIGGIASAQLAFQQALFAVDDFVSSTGGIEYKLRAIGNNITQLGLLLGQSGLVKGLTATKGLFISLGVVLAGQAAVGIYRWITSAKDAQDQSKALSDTLSRQKTLVEELTQAFRTLGDSIGRKGFSAAAQDANDFKKSLEEIRKRQQELRDQRAFGLNQDFLNARADVNAAQQRVDESTTAGESASARQELRESQARLRAVEAQIRNRANRTVEDAASSVDRIFRGRVNEIDPDRAAAAAAATGGGAGAAQGARQIAQAQRDAEERRRAAIAARLAGADTATARNTLEEERRSAIRSGDNTLAAQLEEIINSLEDPTARAIDELSRKILSGAEDVGISLARARTAVDEAISSGVSGAVGLSADINAAGTALKAAVTQLEEAYKIADLDQRRAAVDEANKAVEAAIRQAASLDEQRKSIEAATSVIDRFSDAIRGAVSAAESNLASAEGRRDSAREEALGRPTPRNDRALERAERDVQRQRQLVENARREAAQAEERARQSPEGLADERRLGEIERLLGSTGVLAPGQRERLIDERERLRARQEARARDAANDPRVTAARDASIREEQRQQMAAEGRDLRLDPGQRARRELDDQIARVRTSIGRDIEAAGGDGATIERLLREQQRTEGRLREEAARSVAPTIFGLADQVQNAILQGPSRAALAPTDVTTMEGSRELTRLLRGDDASRNQDLVNLQKEANRLLKLLADNGADVAA